jgi:hypothetical protein
MNKSCKLEANTVVNGDVHLLFELFKRLIVRDLKLEEAGVSLWDTLCVVPVCSVHRVNMDAFCVLNRH